MSALAHLFNRTRFLSFTRRFAPLWVIWVLIFLLPPTRQIARLTFAGSEVSPHLSPIEELWPFDAYGDNFDLEPLLAREPKNPDVAWWHMRQNNEDDYQNYYYSNEPLTDIHFNRAWAVIERFPREKWLRAAPFRQMLQAYHHTPNPFSNPNSITSAAVSNEKELHKTLRQVQIGARGEPQNAFWPLAQAFVLLSTKRRSEILPLIERASKCAYYSDHSLESARRLVRVQSRFRELSWEERATLLSRGESYGQNSAIDALAFVPLREAIRAKQLGNDGRALQMAGIVLRLSQMLGEGDNSFQIAQTGARWQSWVRHLSTPGLQGKKVPTFGANPPNIKVWTAYATKNGKPQLAKLATQLQTRAAQLKEWERETRASSMGYFFFTAQLTDHGQRFGAVNSAHVWRYFNLALGCALLYLAFFWTATNVFLARGKGAASSRRDRVFPAVVVASGCALLGLGVMLWFFLQWNGNTARSPGRDELMFSLTAFAFVALPFLLGLWCALGTMRRFRSQMLGSPRVDLEMRLSPPHAHLLRDFLPFAVGCAIFTFLFGWSFWISATLLDWGQLDLLSFLPPDRKGSHGDFDLAFHPVHSPFILIYGVLICVVFFVAWFFKWRYGAPSDVQKIAHGGLRWWKETLGAAICFASLLFFIIALVSLPTRNRAALQVETLSRHGELFFAPGGAFLNRKKLQKQNAVEAAASGGYPLKKRLFTQAASSPR